MKEAALKVKPQSWRYNGKKNKIKNPYKSRGYGRPRPYGGGSLTLTRPRSRATPTRTTFDIF